MKPLQILAQRLAASFLLFGALGNATFVSADTFPGRAEVRAIKGTATYATNGGPGRPLKVGAVLSSPTVIKTGPQSSVDLFLGISAGVIRVAANSTLSLDKLAITETGADTAVEIQLNLPDGDMYFNVNKISKASRYEIKMPNGVAGIRGTKGSFSFRQVGASKPPVVLVDGRLVFVHAPAGGPMTSHLMSAPPPVYFSAVEGIKIAPPDLVAAVDGELTDIDKVISFETPPAPPPNPPVEPFMSPGGGEASSSSSSVQGSVRRAGG
jgi:hypothetical protein